METTLHILLIGFCTLTSVLFSPQPLIAAEARIPELDRLAPEHVEQATFAMG